MKLMLSVFCLLGMSFGWPADSEQQNTLEDSLRILTVDHKGRLLDDISITTDELKAVQEQLGPYKQQSARPKGRTPQSPAYRTQAVPINKEPFFAPQKHPFYRTETSAPMPSSQAIALPEASTPQAAQQVYTVPLATHNPQLLYKTQPLYILNPAVFEGEALGTGASANLATYPYTGYSPYRTIWFQELPTVTAGNNGGLVINPAGIKALCKFNIFTGKTECYGS